MIERYPLTWPADKPRTPKDQRKTALFAKKVLNGNYNASQKLSVADAVKRVESELDDYTKVGHDYRVPTESIIISTNLPAGKKGKPLSSLSEPEDTGVAVYFKLDGVDYCLPCDKWNRTADNLAAVAAHINALRSIERWGVGQQHDVYTGFKALPEAVDYTEDPWWEVLVLDRNAPVNTINQRFKYLAKMYHPDNKTSGSHSMFIKIKAAYDAAMKGKDS